MLTCHSLLVPPLWMRYEKKNEHVVVKGNTLILESALPSDSGTYICKGLGIDNEIFFGKAIVNVGGEE